MGHCHPGVNKGDLTEDKLIRVRISDSKVLEGTWKPTSELEMHLNVYRTDNEIMSTVHAPFPVPEHAGLLRH